MRKFVNQWGIYIVDLGSHKGSVQGGVRPCLILQNAIGNSYSPTTICCPITHKEHKSKIPPHYVLHKKDYPFFTYENNLILCEQITTIDVQNQVVKYLGMVKDVDRECILDTFLSNFILE